ncbi:hypothetical protein PF002_g10088 [Phytophthora fragariae]|uniref:Uncharacterized protein n=1 Tax=Phytophthora fragariae TaxID=53985 RepID=A0A6A3ZR87_9STRA|nr:hypothetical protein PF002_g10088 [Phytophthora fragariae]
MTYDIENMIPHTCHLGQEDVQLNDASALINVEDDIREFVDGLADQDIPANQIWMFYAASKFYAASTCVVRGLSRSQVIKRIGNAKADTKMFSLVETPDLAKVKNEIVGFSQFNYAWHDDSRAKQGKSGIERLIGWSHPELRNLLRYDDSDADNDDIDAENTGVAEDDDAQLSDDELGMLYDTSFDHEKAMESDAAA